MTDEMPAKSHKGITGVTFPTGEATMPISVKTDNTATKTQASNNDNRTTKTQASNNDNKTTKTQASNHDNTTTNKPTTKNPTRKKDKSCRSGNECVPSEDCKSFKEERKKLNELPNESPGHRILLNKLKSMVCNVQKKKVCCHKDQIQKSMEIKTNTQQGQGCDPSSPCHRPSLEDEMCGLDNTHAGFFGVEDTRIGEFPFLVLLGRETRGSVSWHCGGSLVNR